MIGGLGTAVSEFLTDQQLDVPLKRLGIPDVHVPHGDPNAQHEEFGYGTRAMRSALSELGIIQAEMVMAKASD